VGQASETPFKEMREDAGISMMFHATFPLKEEETGTMNMKVLIVDDDEGLGALIKAMIERDGCYTIRTAGDGQEGYLTYLLFQPDIIITDIEMPRKTGLQMVTAIRAYDPKVRIIYMSGDLDRFWSLLEKEKNQYQARFLRKPFSRSELTTLLSEGLKGCLPDYCYE
jgi:YesN/AraC family two-component response regulator